MKVTLKLKSPQFSNAEMSYPADHRFICSVQSFPSFDKQYLQIATIFESTGIPLSFSTFSLACFLSIKSFIAPLRLLKVWKAIAFSLVRYIFGTLLKKKALPEMISRLSGFLCQNNVLFCCSASKSWSIKQYVPDTSWNKISLQSH